MIDSHSIIMPSFSVVYQGKSVKKGSVRRTGFYDQHSSKTELSFFRRVGWLICYNMSAIHPRGLTLWSVSKINLKKDAS